MDSKLWATFVASRLRPGSFTLHLPPASGFIVSLTLWAYASIVTDHGHVRPVGSLARFAYASYGATTP